MIRPAVLGATIPGKPGASIALMPLFSANRKSVPPGLEAKIDNKRAMWDIGNNLRCDYHSRNCIKKQVNIPHFLVQILRIKRLKTHLPSTCEMLRFPDAHLHSSP